MFTIDEKLREMSPSAKEEYCEEYLTARRAYRLWHSLNLQEETKSSEGRS